MSKSMMDLNLLPDITEATALQHEAEMDMLNAHKALMKFYESFGVYVDKLKAIKADMPLTAFNIEKEDYGNSRDKRKVTQSAQDGINGSEKPQFRPTQGNQRQAGMAAQRFQREERE